MLNTAWEKFKTFGKNIQSILFKEWLLYCIAIFIFIAAFSIPTITYFFTKNLAAVADKILVLEREVRNIEQHNWQEVHRAESATASADAQSVTALEKKRNWSSRQTIFTLEFMQKKIGHYVQAFSLSAKQKKALTKIMTGFYERQATQEDRLWRILELREAIYEILTAEQNLQYQEYLQTTLEEF